MTDSLYSGAAFVAGLLALLLFVVAIADYLNYLSTNIVGTFTYADFTFLGIVFVIVALACAAKAD
jgi:hypothetical protein